MNIYKKKLNVLKIPLKGLNLIEASAGTGKTFTIVLLFLRLLLGIGKKNTAIKKLFVHEILVVTFTNSAKEELYKRIKESIENLYDACIKKDKNNYFFQFFLKEIHDIEEVTRTLQQAQNDINNISIYTIHGFCKKMLKSHNFYFHALFKDKILENEEELYLKATQDFWRFYFYDLPENMIKIIYQEYKNPEFLLKKVKPFFFLKSIHFKENNQNETLIKYHQKNIREIDLFKKKWLMYYPKILKKISLLKINKKIYNQFNVNRWINDIKIWAQSSTEDYIFPISLKYFTQENIKKNIVDTVDSNHTIFEETEKILKKKFSLKNIILFYAIKNIPKFLEKEKKKKNLLGFDDLLNIFSKTIHKEKIFKEIIRKKYPVTLIDEFQDVDIQQYKIFTFIYKKNKKTALFLIGDPKQSLYGFRGSDIFSYLHIKSKIKKYYYLDINWRSSIRMSESINLLFSQKNNPFIFKNIPFIPVIPSLNNMKMNFHIKGIAQTPISFFFNKANEICLDDYQSWIAKKCANEINYWLTCAKKKEAIITNKNGEKRTLEASDIAILVKNKKEANIIQKELKKTNIFSKYSSSQRSVFHTIDAQELLYILKSILEPNNEILIQQSNSTDIIKQLFSIKKDKCSFFVIEKLYQYYDIWENSGIFQMIKKIILDYQDDFNFLENNIDEQKIFNFLHIGELLQIQSQYFHKKTSLVHWFEKKIKNQIQPSYIESIKNISKSKEVKIITIHKSKGLEYPIVWIPFASDFNQSKNAIYHDKNSFQMFFDIENSIENLILSDKERLAEDLRFLYVALTRATLHCSIGIACIIKKKIKNRKNSDLHLSALGYIIQNGNAMNYEALSIKLNNISNNDLIEINYKKINLKSFSNETNIYLLSKEKYLKKEIKNTCNITSFTQLIKENQFFVSRNKNIKKENILKQKIKQKKLSIHNFPKGKKTGLLMHHILRNLKIINQKNDDWFSIILEKYDFSIKWTSTLVSWIFNILNTQLNNQTIMLSKLKKNTYKTELEFFLPIRNIIYKDRFNEIIQSFDTLSICSPQFFFNPITGIIQGFIDLVFLWNNKYYIVDYKSNWLGENNSFYSKKNIKQEMIKNRYDIQYQIYTMALNQYLKQKIKNYEYKKNFGGIFYIFLRAISNEKNDGIFYTMPKSSLIDKLISLIL